MMKLPTAIWPEFRPGRTSAMVENVDLFPTLAELGAGAPLKMCPADAARSRATKECTEGLSFAPLLTGASGSRGRMGGAAESLAPSNVWKRASFSQYNRQGEALPNAVMGYSIRVPGWRYTGMSMLSCSNLNPAYLFSSSHTPRLKPPNPNPNSNLDTNPNANTNPNQHHQRTVRMGLFQQEPSWVSRRCHVGQDCGRRAV